MVPRMEDRMLFYAALNGYATFCDSFFHEAVKTGIDRQYLTTMAEALDVAGGLYERLTHAGLADDPLMEALRPRMVEEMQRTASMKHFMMSVFELFDNNGIGFFPLKGCDSRLCEGARGFFNVMQDIDIAVAEEDIFKAGELLESAGFLFQGAFSGSHLTYFTNEEPPLFLELHWDIINRGNPLHSRLFTAPLSEIRNRLITIHGRPHLSEGDLLAYSIAHAVKEYFHKPKWLADIAWIVEHCLTTDNTREIAFIIEQWSMGGALGIVAAGLSGLLPEFDGERLREYGAVKPGMPGRYLSRHIVSYSTLHRLKPVIFTIVADGITGKTSVLMGMTRLSLLHRKP